MKSYFLVTDESVEKDFFDKLNQLKDLEFVLFTDVKECQKALNNSLDNNADICPGVFVVSDLGQNLSYLKHWCRLRSSLLSTQRRPIHFFYFDKNKGASYRPNQNGGVEKGDYFDGGQYSGLSWLCAAEMMMLSSGKELVQRSFLLSGDFHWIMREHLLESSPALFLDRDGVINFDHGYVYQKEKLQLFPETVELIKNAKERHYKIIVITNQSGIARGFFTLDQMREFHLEMQCKLQQEGAEWDDLYVSPYLQENSLTRKPGAGLFLMAAQKHSIALEKSLMIGDRPSDRPDFLDLASGIQTQAKEKERFGGALVNNRRREFKWTCHQELATIFTDFTNNWDKDVFYE